MYSSPSSSLDSRELAYAKSTAQSTVPSVRTIYDVLLQTGSESALARFGANAFEILRCFATGGPGADFVPFWNKLAKFGYFTQRHLIEHVSSPCRSHDDWTRSELFATGSIGFLQDLVYCVAPGVCSPVLAAAFQTAALKSHYFLSSKLKTAGITLGDWAFANLQLHDSLFSPFKAIRVLKISFAAQGLPMYEQDLLRGYYNAAVERKAEVFGPLTLPPVVPASVSAPREVVVVEGDEPMEVESVQKAGPLQNFSPPSSASTDSAILNELASFLSSYYTPASHSTPISSELDAGVKDLVNLAFVPCSRFGRPPVPTLPRPAQSRKAEQARRPKTAPKLTPLEEQFVYFSDDEESDMMQPDDFAWGSKKRSRSGKGSRGGQRRKRDSQESDQDLPPAKFAKLMEKLVPQETPSSNSAPMARSYTFQKVRLVYAPAGVAV